MDIDTAEPFWLYALLLTEKVANERGIVIPFDIQKEKIYQRVSRLYFEETGVVLTDQDKLYDWVQERNRFELLNALIHRLLMDLLYGNEETEYNPNKKDLFLFTNIKPLMKMAAQHAFYCYTNRGSEDETLSSISKDETLRFVREILRKINPEWENLFNKVLEDNTLIFLDEMTPEEKNKFFKDSDITEDAESFVVKINGKCIIAITKKNNIYDVSSIIHELVHYIIGIQEDRNMPRTLLEFFSIFYETYAAYSLMEYGFSKEEIEFHNRLRSRNTNELIFYTLPLFNYLIIFLEEGKITEEQMVQKEIKSIVDSLEVMPDDVKEYILTKTPEILNGRMNAYARCDSYIDTILSNPNLVFKLYPYIIGHFLSTKLFARMAEDPSCIESVLTTMRLLVEGKINTDVYDVFTLCGIDNEKEDIKRVSSALEDDDPSRK